MQPEIPSGLNANTIIRLIANALAEDFGEGGDITSTATIPADTTFTGLMAARHAMTIAGLSLAGLTFKAVNPGVSWRAEVEDGTQVTAGTVLATVSGSARDLLTAERTALNLVQHLSGIATLARRYVDAIAQTEALILDTRKTLPGYRDLEKYAARMGGATNHRMRLDDQILIKDNHILAAGGVTVAIQRAKNAGHSPIEVECDTLSQVQEALKCGVDAILLDNMSLDHLREAVSIIAGRARTEASGGVTLGTVAAIAATGVDSISVGRITQSAPATDIGFDWNPNA